MKAWCNVPVSVLLQISRLGCTPEDRGRIGLQRNINVRPNGLDHGRVDAQQRGCAKDQKLYSSNQSTHLVSSWLLSSYSLKPNHRRRTAEALSLHADIDHANGKPNGLREL